jgi:hypothetical protein
MLRKRDKQGSVYFVVRYDHASHPNTYEEFDSYSEALEFHEKMIRDSWCSSSRILCVEVTDAYIQRSRSLERAFRFKR